MIGLQWWMRVVGVFYVLLFVGVLTRRPIRTEGPPGVLEQAAAGDPIARFVIDTWTTLGLAIFVIGGMLLFCSREPEFAHSLAWTVVALEGAWGIPIDLYKIARGYNRSALSIFVCIHVVIVITGVLALRGST